MANASQSGSFSIGGDMEVHRLGFGAMRVTGKGIFGEPEDRAECLRVLKRLPELGVNFIDTAAAYGPDVSEKLLREALHPYKGMLIATKGGLARPGPGDWRPNATPQSIRTEAEKSLKNLGLEQIGLWQLHRINPKLPRDEQFAAIAKMQKDGLVKHAGLSEVSIEEIEAAAKHFKVVTVQNRYNLTDRTHEDVLDYCEKHAIGFIPFFPLAAGDLAKEGTVLDRIAKKHDAAPSQIALAWVLKRSPAMLPIPGTSKVKHLEENVAAVDIHLSDEDFAALSEAGKAHSKG